MVGEALQTYDEGEQSSPRHREETFLKTLKTVCPCHEEGSWKAQSLVVRSLNIIDESGQNTLDWLSPADLLPVLQSVVSILRILTVFSLYEDAVEDGKVAIPVESKYPDFCAVMREMLCETWRLFYLLFRRVQGITTLKLPGEKRREDNSIKEKKTRCCELLSIIHEELGVHKWCGLANGHHPQIA
jgi:hypothetical protein